MEEPGLELAVSHAWDASVVNDSALPTLHYFPSLCFRKTKSPLLLGGLGGGQRLQLLIGRV